MRFSCYWLRICSKYIVRGKEVTVWGTVKNVTVLGGEEINTCIYIHGNNLTYVTYRDT